MSAVTRKPDPVDAPGRDLRFHPCDPTKTRTPNIVCWGSHLFAKLPGDGKEVPFHQDAIYWPLTPSKSVTVSLAIDDADDGRLPHEALALDGTRILGRRVTGIESRPGRFVDALDAGQVSLHSDLLLRGSDANRSARRRAGLTLRYASAQVQLIDGYELWRRSAIHLRDGDPDGFWSDRRRPEGERPERMAGFWRVRRPATRRELN